MVWVRSSWTAMTASRTFRLTVFFESSSTFFTYCWVMVDPPSLTSPASALRRRARARARRSTPLWAKKRESSMATTAAFRSARHLRQRHVLPVLLGVEAGDERPVGGEDLGRLGRGRPGGDVDPVGAPGARQGERDDEERGDGTWGYSTPFRCPSAGWTKRRTTVPDRDRSQYSSGAPGSGHRRSRPHRRGGGHQPHLRGRPAQEAGPGRAAPGEARHRPDGLRHPPRVRRRAPQAPPVPGPGPHRGADPGRLHRPGRRPHRPVGHPPPPGPGADRGQPASPTRPRPG